MNPDAMYTMARQNHQSRVAGAARRREVREVQNRRVHQWLAAVAGRLRPAHGSTAPVAERHAVLVTNALPSPAARAV